jgi:hypothetical protein
MAKFAYKKSLMDTNITILALQKKKKKIGKQEVGI